MKEAFDDIIREYIDFVNGQVGVYMDALAGFAGHYARVERQVHRIQRPVRRTMDGTVVWASYEDPSKPDVIHNRILRAEDYLAVNAKGGSNEQQHAKAIVVFLFTYWEDEIRPRLAAAKGVAVQKIRSDTMGDLRILRNVILHEKSILKANKHSILKNLGKLFPAEQSIQLPYECMHQVFILVKRDCAKLLFEWLGVKGGPIQPDKIVNIAIQKGRRRKTNSKD